MPAPATLAFDEGPAVVYDNWMTVVTKLAAWVVLAAVAFATLCPVELRPHVSSPDLERFATFAALGLIFGFAYAKKGVWFALGIVVGSAFGLELLQLIDPSRDGRLADALFKATGGILGSVTGHLVRLMLDRRRLA